MIVVSSSITQDDINRLKLQKYFLTWVGIARTVTDNYHPLRKRKRNESVTHKRNKSPKRNTPHRVTLSPK